MGLYRWPPELTAAVVISYLMTTAGPQPLEPQRQERRIAHIDYKPYLSRQLQPVADAILPLAGDDFAALVDRQLGLF